MFGAGRRPHTVVVHKQPEQPHTVVVHKQPEQPHTVVVHKQPDGGSAVSNDVTSICIQLNCTGVFSNTLLQTIQLLGDLCPKPETTFCLKEIQCEIIFETTLKKKQ